MNNGAGKRGGDNSSKSASSNAKAGNEPNGANGPSRAGKANSSESKWNRERERREGEKVKHTQNIPSGNRIYGPLYIGAIDSI